MDEIYPPAVDGGRKPEFFILSYERAGVVDFALKENLTNAELEFEFEQGRLVVPKELQNMIQSPDHAIEPMTRSAFLKNKILRWFHTRSNSNQNADNPELDKLVRYLEAQLEIEHDNGNQ